MVGRIDNCHDFRDEFLQDGLYALAQSGRSHRATLAASIEADGKGSVVDSRHDDDSAVRGDGRINHVIQHVLHPFSR